MKKSLFFKTLVCLSVVILPIFSFAAGGGSGPGGGNTDAIQFRSLARAALERFVVYSKDSNLISDAKEILSKVNSNEVNVVMVDRSLYYLGGEVDALNYPEQNRIEVNQGRINQRSYMQRLQLSIHEFAGLAQVEDVNNVVSNELSNPAAFQMHCWAEINDYASAATNGTSIQTLAHATMVEAHNKENDGQYLDYHATLGGELFDIFFQFDKFAKYSSVEVWAYERAGQGSVIRYGGWNSYLYITLPSVRYPGKEILLQCSDNSENADNDAQYKPDFDNLVQN